MQHRIIDCIDVAQESFLETFLPVPHGLSSGVTDGARTRDLRSHNPMLYLLSYGHHARRGFYQR